MADLYHCYKIIFILFFLIGLGIGFFLIVKPNLVIEIQKKFYAKINWNMEPISMEKEIRNTKIMGWITIVVMTLGIVFILR